MECKFQTIVPLLVLSSTNQNRLDKLVGDNTNKGGSIKISISIFRTVYHLPTLLCFLATNNSF